MHNVSDKMMQGWIKVPMFILYFLCSLLHSDSSLKNQESAQVSAVMTGNLAQPTGFYQFFTGSQHILLR